MKKYSLSVLSFLFPLITLCQSKQLEEDRILTDWAFTKRFAQQNIDMGRPVKGEKRVVFIGDSITERWFYMCPDFFKNKSYIGRGISGQTTPQMLIRFRQDVINLSPKVVVILGGVNDIAEKTGPSTLEFVLGNIASMAELAKANKITVIICSILPVYNSPSGLALQRAQKVSQLNNLIKKYAKARGIIYADFYSAMVNAQGGLSIDLAGDGVHPTLKGYKIMEPIIEKAIDKAISGR